LAKDLTEFPVSVQHKFAKSILTVKKPFPGLENLIDSINQKTSQNIEI